jgi:hypothetical protein
MDVYCDDQIGRENIEDTGGGGLDSHGIALSRKTMATGYLPDDVLSLVADYACEYITDNLAFSLLSDQHRDIMIRKLCSDGQMGSLSCDQHVSIFDLENLMEYFLTWSQIRIGGDPTFVTSEPSSSDSLSFYCKTCHSLIITQNEVDSPHYHGGYGPAFLANFVYNCHYSADEAYETQFTTGVYRVCDVTCYRCSSRVGKKYIEARDPNNNFKVGKILLEQTLLMMPKCCDHRRNLDKYPEPAHYFCARESGVSCFCSVCLAVVKRTTARAVLAMTRNTLDRNLTTRLLSLLIHERHIIAGGALAEVDDELATSSPRSQPSLIGQKFGSVMARLGLGPRDSPVSPNSLRAEIGNYGNHDTRIPRLKPDALQYLARSIGARIALFPENQNWSGVLKFATEIVQLGPSFPGLSIPRACIIESLVSHCGPMSYHSASLLLSRLAQNSEDRRAAIEAVSQKESLTNEEINSLSSMAGPTHHQIKLIERQRWFTPFG